MPGKISTRCPRCLKIIPVENGFATCVSPDEGTPEHLEWVRQHQGEGTIEQMRRTRSA